MKRRFNIIGLLILAVAALFGAFNHFPSATLKAVKNDPKLIFYGLGREEFLDETKTVPVFHGYKILRQTVLSEPSDRVRLVEGLRRAARGAWDQAACFNPRHGIRASDQTGTYDILLCFECIQAEIYFPDGHVESISINGSSATFDQLLETAHSAYRGQQQ